MIYSNIWAHETGVMNTHIFVGTESKLTDVFGACGGLVQTFLKCVQDWVRFQGASIKLIGDAAQMYKSWSLLR